MGEPTGPADRGTGEAEGAVDGLPVETWLDVCLSDIHAAIESSLPRMEGSRLETRDLLEQILGYTPPPELLETLKLVAEAPEQSALRMGLGRMLIALAILIRRELHALTEPRRLDPALLRRQARTVPALTGRVQALEDDIRSMREAAAEESDRLRKLRVSLIPPLSRLQGHANLVSRVQRLCAAAVEGSLDAVEGLTPAERDWFEASVGRGNGDGSLVPRALLDAVSLRVGLAADLQEHYRGESVGSRLEMDAAARDLVVDRLRAEASRARDGGHEGLARRLSTAEQELLRLDRKLGAILRGARREGGASPRPRTAGATTRWRVAGLLATAAVLGVSAVIVLGPERPEEPEPGGRPERAAADDAPGPGAEAEFTRVDRDGDTLVAEITAWAWQRMTPEDRQDRVYSLGVMAFSQGAREVWIVDGDRTELAKWFQGGSIRILSPDGEPASVSRN